MKKLVWLIFGFAFISSACLTLAPTASPATSLPTQLVTEVVTSTPAPSPTAKPMIPTDDPNWSGCLEHLKEALPQTSFQDLSGAYAENDVTMKLVLYEVTNGQLGEPQFLYVPEDFKAFQQDTAAQQNAWAYATSLLPSDQLKWISQFMIFRSTHYGGSVTPGGTSQNDRAHWTLSIDIAGAQDPIWFTHMLVHEYAHLISLNTDQIPTSKYYYSWYQNPATCPQLISPEGCSLPNSYLNLFYQKFWKDIFEDWQKDVERGHVNSSEESYARVEKFYEKHPEQFMRAYAATNVREDLAESFTAFILEPPPGENSIIEQKIKFFYDFPELVEMRKQMIQNICSYTKQ